MKAKTNATKSKTKAIHKKKHNEIKKMKVKNEFKKETNTIRVKNKCDKNYKKCNKTKNTTIKAKNKCNKLRQKQ